MAIRLVIPILLLYIFQGCATEYSKEKIVSVAENYLSEGKPERAYLEFKSVIDEASDDLELHREFIKFAVRLHRCDDALDYYNKYREGQKRHVYFYAKALLGVSCLISNKNEIMDYFEEAIRLRPDDKEIRMRYAVVLAEYDMYDKALNEFVKLSQVISNSASLYSYIALCSAYLGEAETVRKSVRDMLLLNFSSQDLKRATESLSIINFHCLDVPDDIRDEFTRVFDMIILEDKPAQAREIIENLLSSYPKVPALHLLKSISLSLTGEYSSALYELNYLGDSFESCGHFQYASGIIYLGVQRNEKALSLFERAIELDPLFVSVYKILSELYLERQDYLKAADVLNIYLKLNPDDHKNRFLYGRTLVKLGRIKEAEDQFNYIFEHDPDNIFGLVGKGIVEKEYAKLSRDRRKRENHLKNSLNYLNMAIKKDPENENIKSLIKFINGEEE
ncbi:MAG: tetratricopeptide repeat protein [Deltaproteobacteria bacterium]|nr:tetratricopeptide repeat protein [Deltaproteobacteria bacterium]